MEFLNNHVVSLMIFLPLVTGLGVLFVPGRSCGEGGSGLKVARWVSLGGALVTFLLSCHVWYYFDGTTSDLQFVEQYSWLPAFGIQYFVGVDGLNLLLIMLTTFLTLLILVHQWSVEETRQKYFLSLLMTLECGMIGALVAFDVVFFYVFWEAMLIPMYFMIGLWGGARRIYAATKFMIYTVFGSLLMLVAAIVLYQLHFEEFGIYSTSLLDLYRLKVLGNTQLWLFGAFALAFAIKVPLWPFHTWLPDAHVEAPTVGSVILAGVLLKMGTYGFLRFSIPLFPEAITFAAPFLVSLGVIGIIYGALTAWVQKDAKKLVAYSSVSHLGFVVVGSLAFAASGGMSEEALTGAVYQMINHGISTGALFFLVGVIYERRHTRQLDAFGGLAKVMPWFAVMLVIATLSSVGLPGTGGFVGEFLILLGTFKVNPLAGVMASLGVLLGAIYMLTFVKKILFGPCDKEENLKLKDLSFREFVYLTPLAFLAILMGVVPGLFLDKVRPSIAYLAKNYHQYHLQIAASDLDHNSHLEPTDKEATE